MKYLFIQKLAQVGNDSQVILVIDDEAEILGLLNRYLTRKGYQVFTASNLEEGRKQLLEIKPTMMFLDVNLPDGNGLKELPIFKSKSPSVEVIMMSAFDHSEARQKAQLNGAKGFLSKPFNLEAINQLLS